MKANKQKQCKRKHPYKIKMINKKDRKKAIGLGVYDKEIVNEKQIDKKQLLDFICKCTRQEKKKFKAI